MITQYPIPQNEPERILSLSALDLDYIDLQNSLKDLTRLAAGIAGTAISLVNLIDHYNQWSISSFGIPSEHILREDSVCQYTIMEDDHFEVPDLNADERFKDKFYVTGDAALKYYLGVPLTAEDGQNIGALCVLDKKTITVEPEKVELLKIIAKDIMVRLKSKKAIDLLKRKVGEMKENQSKLAHDLRGPIGGIVGLARLYKRRAYSSNVEKVAEVFDMIENSGQSVLALAEDILDNTKKTTFRAKTGKSYQYTLLTLKEAIEKLCLPMADNKNIRFSVNAAPKNGNVFFEKDKLLQICSNLVSNAVKFTLTGGIVTVALAITVKDYVNLLCISIEDNGIGITGQKINNILNGTVSSSNGTFGETGYGLGLSLVKHLVDNLDGTMQIFSHLNKGTRFEIELPLKNDIHQITLPEPAFYQFAY